jgi:hypothetical protein
MNCLKKRSALGPFIPQSQTSLKLSVRRFNAGRYLCTQQFRRYSIPERPKGAIGRLQPRLAPSSALSILD